jgi:hypothetical protein
MYRVKGHCWLAFFVPRTDVRILPDGESRFWKGSAGNRKCGDVSGCRSCPHTGGNAVSAIKNCFILWIPVLSTLTGSGCGCGRAGVANWVDPCRFFLLFPVRPMAGVSALLPPNNAVSLGRCRERRQTCSVRWNDLVSHKSALLPPAEPMT